MRSISVQNHSRQHLFWFYDCQDRDAGIRIGSSLMKQFTTAGKHLYETWIRDVKLSRTENLVSKSRNINNNGASWHYLKVDITERYAAAHIFP